MSNIATGLYTALTSSLGQLGGAVNAGIQAAIPGLISGGLPLLIQAATAKRTSHTYGMVPAGGETMNGNYYPAVMPGGAPLSLVPGGPSLTPVYSGGPTMLQRGLAELGLGSGTRMPRTIEQQDAAGRTRTYVLAPMVKYRVSISRAGRRRCSGGR